MNVVIDIDKEVIDFALRPPLPRPLDFVPGFIKNPIRLKFGWPSPTPRERWFLSLVFVKKALHTMAEQLNEYHKAEYGYFKHDWATSIEPGKDGWN